MTKIIIIALFIALAVAVVIWQGKKNEEFLAGAKKAAATVMRKDERQPKMNVPTRKDHWLVYSYQIDGENFTAEDSVEFDDLWQSVSVGQQIDIYYKTDKPSVSHPVALLDRRLKLAGKNTTP